MKTTQVTKQHTTKQAMKAKYAPSPFFSVKSDCRRPG
jgi:hypothetical protein